MILCVGCFVRDYVLFDVLLLLLFLLCGMLV